MRSFGRMGVVACVLCGILSSCTEHVSVSKNVSEIPLIFRAMRVVLRFLIILHL